MPSLLPAARLGAAPSTTGTAAMVPALSMTPLAPGRTASAADASMRPPAWLVTVLAAVVTAFQSTTWAPPLEAFNDRSSPKFSRVTVTFALLT